MKEIKVSEEACIGCGACVAIDPEHFEFNDNGLSEAINNENLESTELQNAIESCPTSAIFIDETHDSSEAENCNCDCEECNCTETCDCGCDNCNCGEDCNCDNECCCECENCHNCE